MAALDFESAAPARSGEAARPDAERARVAVRRWLYAVLGVLLVLVLVGGGTRLTDSGLSITEWEPVHGVVPPLSTAAWETEFEKYRQIPEYRQINRGMSLAEFKIIYWWEWGHRLLARGVGLLFALPLAFFWLTRRLEPALKPRLLALLALGGLQGVVGWWMVASGLTERTDVSQYRLAVHLTLASVIVAAIAWVARGLRADPEDRSAPALPAGVLVFAVLAQIYFGALVAGLDAGLAYNTWPLMDGAVVPSGLLAAEPWWLNAFENAKAVQFVHRSFAFVVVAALVWAAISAWDSGVNARRRAALLGVLVFVQAAIGIATLLQGVPISLALLHQGTAIVLLIAAVWNWRAAVGTYPMARPEESAERAA